MREILFRGKRIDNGEWVEGYYCKYERTVIGGVQEYHMIVPYYASDLYGFEVDPNTVGQYTGFTANGKKIFEGDICKFDNGELDNHGSYTNYVIRWDRVNSQYIIANKFNWNGCLNVFFVIHAEVIGNIHDNPELLEDKS